MKISIISLKKLPTFSESDSGVADFWKNKIVQNNSEVTYQPVWQTCDWGNMLITS